MAEKNEDHIWHPRKIGIPFWFLEGFRHGNWDEDKEKRKEKRERKIKKRRMVHQSQTKPLHQHELHVEVDRNEMIWMTLRKGGIGCHRPPYALPKYISFSHALAHDNNFSQFPFFSFILVFELASFDFILKDLNVSNHSNQWNQNCVFLNWASIACLIVSQYCENPMWN